MRRVRRAMAWAVAAASLAGCRSAAIESENDRLRAAAVEAEDRIAALEAERDELRARLAEARPERPALAPPDDDAIPRLAKVELRSGSTLLDDDGDGRSDRLRIRVRGLDGRARDLQLAGPIEATASAIGGPECAARTVGRCALSASEVRDAYRSSAFGTHYVVEIPLDPALLADDPLAVRVIHRDLRTGQVHEATAMVGEGRGR